jgi:uncharacterized integral membrane protein
MDKKNPTITELGTFWTQSIKIIFAIFFFFIVRLIDSVEVRMVLLFKFFNFPVIISSEIDNIFEGMKICFRT